MPLSPDFLQALKRSIQGEVRVDLPTRLLYSTDASIYQIEPLGVAFPRTLDDLSAAVEIAAAHSVPVLARGSGSSLAGQAIGEALVLDCSRYLDRIVEIDPEAQTASVEPGVIMNALNRAAAIHGLQFGPDPASAERATMGGSLANNATGAHSILYGMAADHLISAEVALSDGSLARFEEIRLEEARRRAEGEGAPVSREKAIYRAALEIRERYAPAIREGWPRVWRRASGYNLNYLLPWSPSAPPEWSLANPSHPYPPISPGAVNLAPLLAGSEGTLGVIRRATIRLMPIPAHKALGVLAYPSLDAACDAAPQILNRHPSAIELIPQSLIRLARSVPAYAQLLSFMEQLPGGNDPAALLAVEFSGEDPRQLREQVQALGEDVLLAETAAAQNQVWTVRKVGLGILSSRPGEVKSIAFIEDLAVPVESLGHFVREMERIFAEHKVQGDFYAHASAGCLHIRPMLNISQAAGVAEMRAIASEAVTLAIGLGGAVSGEHGMGLSRGEWLTKLYGGEIQAAMRQLKEAADPQGLLNPQKLLDAPPMNRNLRYGEGYRPQGWKPVMDFTRQGGAPGAQGLVGAVEMCNGAGVCRKAEGVMCPSFQATREEMHSTRGRANLLRAMLSGRFPTGVQAEKTVYEALDLCLACKGCKSECPSAVDVAKLKYEFLQEYYQHHTRRSRDYLFAYIGPIARLGYRLAPLANPLLRARFVRGLGARWLGLAAERVFPSLSSHSLRASAAKIRAAENSQPAEEVFFLPDAFNEFFYPEVGLAALRSLQAAGCRVKILPVTGAGRTLISKGFLEAAKRHAAQVVEAVARLDPHGQIPVVGVEPSEILTLRDEYPEIFPDAPRVTELARRAWMIDEFLIRPRQGDDTRELRIANQVLNRETSGSKPRPKVLLHGHCYQKAQPPAADGYPTGVAATRAMLEAVGYSVAVIDSGCCGMAGAFGYEAEHYAVSMQVGELKLLPAVRSAGSDTLIAASGVSCQSQIEDGSGRKALHPILLVDKLRM